MLKVMLNSFVNDCYFGKSILSSQQQLRWRRKPRWVPQAKSKVFRVPERKPKDPLEYEQLKELFNNYRTQVRSVRSYLQQEVKTALTTSSADHVVLTAEEQELDEKQRINKNMEWNDRIKLVREKRIAIMAKQKEDYVKSKLASAKEMNETNRELADEIVKIAKEKAKHFIGRDQIDDAIEMALRNPVDYSFSIDLKQNIHRKVASESN